MAQDYIALIHEPHQAGGSWGVTFPDLPGCTSFGESFEEAVANAREALSGHIAAMVADGDEVPPPRSYARLATESRAFTDDQKEGAKAIPIQLIEAQPPKERVNIMLARDVLNRIDAAAKAKGVTRSAYIEAVAGSAASKRFL